MVGTITFVIFAAVTIMDKLLFFIVIYLLV